MSKGEEAIVSCGTTKGPIVMRMHRDWSPNGYDRVVELFERGFYDDSHFFRAVPGFLCQFGITYSKDPDLRKLMHEKIPDDPQLEPRIPFDVGIMSFAGGGPNSRTSQIFISYGKAKSLGKELWETPFGEVIEGMENAKNFYSYGDMPPWGKGPVQGKIYNGPQYIEENFPLLDKFERCTVKRTKAFGNGGTVEKSVPVIQRAKSAEAGAQINQLRNVAQVNLGETDPSAMILPENGIVLVGVIVMAVVLVFAVRNGRKIVSKTQ